MIAEAVRLPGKGAAVEELVKDKVFHPHMRQRIPSAITHVYGHQEEEIRAIHKGRTTLVSTGTGSGKTECFLYPIVSRCLEPDDSTQRTRGGSVRHDQGPRQRGAGGGCR